MQVVDFGNRHLGRSDGQFTVSKFAVGGAMHDEVRFCGAVFGRNIPLRGGGADQHRSSGGTHLSHLIKKAADGMRSIRILIAVFWIADRLVNLYLGPIRIEFICNDQRQCSAAAASHLGPACDDRDRAVRRNGHPQTRVEHRSRLALSGPKRLWDITRAEHEGSADQRSLDKSATGNILDTLHTVSFAA